MQKLKLLPWLARQHGVALERAEELWRQAVALADFRRRGGKRTSDHWAYAMRTLLKLMRTDGAAILDSPAPVTLHPAPLRQPVVQLLTSQQRLGTTAFNAAEAYLRAANEIWRHAWFPRRAGR
jgi:hypothetical protein